VTAEPTTVAGRLVLHDRVVAGRVGVADGRITSVEEGARDRDPGRAYIAPGFIDLHVHGWGGHDAMGSAGELDGMARALLRHGVTSFLPTAVTASLPALGTFASTVRGWMPAAPDDGAEPLGFNLEGPFLADARRGVHNPAWIRDPADVATDDLEGLVDGLRLTTVAPERPGAIELIRWLTGRGVRVSLGHSAATLVQAGDGYGAGAVSTTHLFNAMSGVDHHAPGLAVAALTRDDVYVELIADGHHVDRAIWPIITRTKPAGQLLLVSDAVPMAGTGEGRSTLGGLDIEVHGDRATMVGGGTLAGSVIALDRAVQNLVASGVSLPNAVAAASTNPAALLGLADRGRIAVGQSADLVELDGELAVRRVMRRGRWYEAVG
jgi:N-acetylglucosamine-6-phosphate deacetylase